MLNDVRVLDLSLVLPGSNATMVPGDLGAEVVERERLPDGELSRSWEPTIRRSWRFPQRNRNGFDGRGSRTARHHPRYA